MNHFCLWKLAQYVVSEHTHNPTAYSFPHKSTSMLTLGVLGLLKEGKVTTTCANAIVFIRVVSWAGHLLNIHSSRRIIQRVISSVHLLPRSRLVKGVIVGLWQGSTILHLKAAQGPIGARWRHFYTQ